MKRFASIDFLRGCAIIGMLTAHTLGKSLDFKAFVNHPGDRALLGFAVLAAIVCIGGLAGFFLLVSAMGNMVSMQKRLQAGRSVKELIVGQLVGGLLLLVFAYLTESAIGYRGVFGALLHNVHRPDHPDYLEILLGRGFHFETIHTIAWCVLVNGVVQGILSRNGGWKNVRRQVVVYAVLAVLVVALTQPIWKLVETYGGPNGYPWHMTTGDHLSMPNILRPEVTFVDLLKGAFLNPLSAPAEPLFPYLAISFLGSIIGIVISQPREKVPRNFPKIIMTIGLIMFFVGLVGGVWFLIAAATGPGGIKEALEVFRSLPYHRHLYNNPNIPITFTFPLGWLWQFLGVNGAAIMLTMFSIRLVEFRGRGDWFGGKTPFFRRFGFIAFTNYNNQWYIWIVRIIFATVITVTGTQFFAYARYTPGDPFNPSRKLDWAVGLLLLAAVLAVYHWVMRLWEKVGYIGSLEWLILTIIQAILPQKASAKAAERGKRWWEKGKLDVRRAFYDVEWVDIVPPGEVDHANQADSKLAFKLALAGLASIIFMPVTPFTLIVANQAQESEGKNTLNRAAKAMSIAGIALMIGAAICLAFITPGMILP